MAAKKKSKKATPKKITRVAIVVDRSGSMSDIRKAAFEGINSQITTLRENADLGGETFVTYIQFDNVIETVFKNKSAKTVENINYDQFVPRGGTAWRDAVGKTIVEIQEPGDDVNVAYLVLVISDGGENQSTEWTQLALATTIKEKEATGQWTFSYMLANVDALKVAHAYAASVSNVASFTSTPTGAANAFSVMSSGTTEYLRGRGSSVSASYSSNAFYNNASTLTVVPDSPTGANIISGAGTGGITTTPKI